MIAMIGSVVTGILIGRLFHVPVPDFLITLLLTGLVFFVGMEIGSEEGVFQKLRKSLPAIGFQSALTISGSLIFGGLSFFLIRTSGFSPIETMGASAGLGWYSLSAVMISEIHLVTLGTVAFIVNLFRELFAILLIPILSRFFPLAAASTGGAASMDVLLGLISRHNRLEVTLIAFGQGVVCSTMVPVLITLIFRES